MHADHVHTHSSGPESPSAGERRTRIVVGLTFVTMVVEIVVGLISDSMALLADGWHMATHAGALGVAAYAFAFARKRARDPRFSFGTGKVSALAGFGSAVSLMLVAIVMCVQSVTRLLTPIPILFDEAIAVAVLGLCVNLASAVLLSNHGHGRHIDGGHLHDHNLRGAYLHVVADALTSVLALAALAAGKLLGWLWMDPVMAVFGSLIIAHWSLGLLKDTSAVLLDADVPVDQTQAIKAAIEVDPDNRVIDLHLWRIAPRRLAAIVSLVALQPRAPSYYKGLLRNFKEVAHVTIEVHPHGDNVEAGCRPFEAEQQYPFRPPP